MEVLDPVLDRHLIALETARKNIQIADHMLNMTFKLVNDPKVLLLVLERLMTSLRSALGSVLYLERKYKRIPPFHEDMGTMIDVFKARCTRRYNLDESYAELVRDVWLVHKEHTKSPVEFRRGDKYVICSDTLHMHVLSREALRNYIERAKAFIRDVDSMVQRYEIH